MNDEDVINLVDGCFHAIEKAHTTDEIDRIFDDNVNIAPNRPDRDAFPYINFTISREEVQSLIDKKLLTYNQQNKYRFAAKLADTNSLSILEKLLYAMAWKNGDLKKIDCMIRGIKDEQIIGQSVVFHFFGKALEDPKNPIVDQHVIRAFKIYTRTNNQIVSMIRKKDVLYRRDLVDINNYVQWIKGDSLTKELRKVPNYFRHIDDVLFALGKTIKS